MEDELTSEEESQLRELIIAVDSGDNVSDFINRRLYEELSTVMETDRFGNEARSYDPDFDRQEQLYQSLSDKGYIETRHPTPGIYWYDYLTSKGRCYFKDKAAREEARHKALTESRRHDYRVASYGAIAGGVLGLFSGAFSSQAISWIKALIQGISQ